MTSGAINSKLPVLFKSDVSGSDASQRMPRTLLGSLSSIIGKVVALL